MIKYRTLAIATVVLNYHRVNVALRSQKNSCLERSLGIQYILIHGSDTTYITKENA